MTDEAKQAAIRALLDALISSEPSDPPEKMTIAGNVHTRLNRAQLRRFRAEVNGAEPWHRLNRAEAIRQRAVCQGTEADAIVAADAEREAMDAMAEWSLAWLRREGLD